MRFIRRLGYWQGTNQKERDLFGIEIHRVFESYELEMTTISLSEVLEWLQDVHRFPFKSMFLESSCK